MGQSVRDFETMEKKYLLIFALLAVPGSGLPDISLNPRNNLTRNPKTFSLFSIVQFPNLECVAGSSSTTKGTCLTTSECTDKGGAADGDWASGFGVCFVIAISNCPAVVAHNLTYVQNSNYPTGYLPTTANTCTFTVNKVNDNICQLRLDFETFSGLATSALGTCSDSLAVVGMSGYNPPTICGTNTGYHMYAEFGSLSTDAITMTFTHADLTSTKMYNVLLQQIPCDAEYRAPTDCVQYFTGLTGSVANYGFGSGDLLINQEYTMCIRTEAGMCGISWCQATMEPSGSQTFKMSAPVAANTVKTEVCNSATEAVVIIPHMSLDGISTLPMYGTIAAAAAATSAGASTNQAFVNRQCGGLFGAWGTSIAGQANGAGFGQCLVSRVQPFTVGFSHGANPTGNQAKDNGFRLEYTQVPCV